MSWTERTVRQQRLEFVLLAEQAQVNVRELCRRFGIRPSTAYKWLARYRAEGAEGLADRTQRPRKFRCPTSADMVALVVGLRQENRAWGGRKIRHRLLNMGHGQVPAASTITGILHRHRLITAEESDRHRRFRRFERAAPNDLWQMDFKGHFALACGRCHPLTILDDHSRFNLCLKACADERSATVRSHLVDTFQCYGLPWELLCDNGPPWAAAGGCFTELTAWLIRLGITVIHGRPFHPQTQGKDERFHRTLDAELLLGRRFEDHQQVQRSFDPWRETYNCQRPHQALEMCTPVSRYRPSDRAYPSNLPPVEYAPGEVVRIVQANGRLSYGGRRWFVSQAFAGQPVALRPTSTDGVLNVFYCHQRVAQIDLRGQNQE